jgi:hypothetical protein
VDVITSTWWFQIVNWIGPFLVVLSLVLKRVLQFRWVNLIGSAISATCLAMTGGWPFVAMNLAIVIINVMWLIRLYKEKATAASYEIVHVDSSDAFFNHVLRTNADDIATTTPGFNPVSAPGEVRSAYLILKGNETVGAIELADQGNGIGKILLDWVAPKYRDFTPGQFVYNQAGNFQNRGFHTLVRDNVGVDSNYLQNVGFELQGSNWVRKVS